MADERDEERYPPLYPEVIEDRLRYLEGENERLVGENETLKAELEQILTICEQNKKDCDMKIDQLREEIKDRIDWIQENNNARSQQNINDLMEMAKSEREQQSEIIERELNENREQMAQVKQEVDAEIGVVKSEQETDREEIEYNVKRIEILETERHGDYLRLVDIESKRAKENMPEMKNEISKMCESLTRIEPKVDQHDTDIDFLLRCAKDAYANIKVLKDRVLENHELPQKKSLLPSFRNKKKDSYKVVPNVGEPFGYVHKYKMTEDEAKPFLELRRKEFSTEFLSEKSPSTSRQTKSQSATYDRPIEQPEREAPHTYPKSNSLNRSRTSLDSLDFGDGDKEEGSNVDTENDDDEVVYL